MLLFSDIFKDIGTNTPFLPAYRLAGGLDPAGGGWALERFNSIVDAHSSVDGIIEEFGLDQEDCIYSSIDGYENPWVQAYEEEYERAEIKAATLSALGIIVDPEDLINWERVDKDAYRYAIQLATAWLDGSEWIPEEVLDWAWYVLSSHNN